MERQCQKRAGLYFKLLPAWAIINVLVIVIYNVQWKNPTYSIALISANASKQSSRENVSDSESFIDPSNYVSRCSPGDMFALQQSRHTNANVLVPISRKIVCPRNLTAGSPNLPLTALISFPGSGNTWMRHILQQMTGFPTGSIYHDDSLLKNGFPFEGEVTNVIAVKTHGVNHQGAAKYIPVHAFDRIIVLLRNVYDCLLSDYKRYILTSDHVSNSYLNVSDPRWKSYVFNGAKKWEAFVKDTLSFTGPTMVVFYEDLKTDLLSQLVRIAKYLRSDEVTNFSLCCAMKEVEGSFHRKSSEQKVEDVFNWRLRRRVNKKIRSAAANLINRHRQVSKRLWTHLLPL